MTLLKQTAVDSIEAMEVVDHVHDLGNNCQFSSVI